MQMFVATPLLLLPMWHLDRRFGAPAALGLCLGVLAVFWAAIAGLSAANDWTSSSFLVE